MQAWKNTYHSCNSLPTYNRSLSSFQWKYNINCIVQLLRIVITEGKSHLSYIILDRSMWSTCNKYKSFEIYRYCLVSRMPTYLWYTQLQILLLEPSHVGLPLIICFANDCLMQYRYIVVDITLLLLSNFSFWSTNNSHASIKHSWIYIYIYI